MAHEEEGSAARRRALPNGRIVSSKEFREGKQTQEQSASDDAAKMALRGFKQRRLDARILTENATAEAQLTSTGAIKTVPLMISFVRARTNEVVKEKGEELKALVLSVRDKPLAIKLGLEPDGYQACWRSSSRPPRCRPRRPRRPSPHPWSPHRPRQRCCRRHPRHHRRASSQGTRHTRALPRSAARAATDDAAAKKVDDRPVG